MKVSEIKEQTREELETKLADIKKNLFNLKFQKASGQLDNPMKIRNLRKDIARIKTLLKEKESDTGISKETNEASKVK